MYRKDGLITPTNCVRTQKWYTSDGEEYADVTAKDFVTGLKHAVDKKSEALYMVEKFYQRIGCLCKRGNKGLLNGRN